LGSFHAYISFVIDSRRFGPPLEAPRNTAMDWKQQAKLIFNVEKPAHFVDSMHCSECAEHDQTLLAFDVDSIGLAQLGNPGWDPLCFSSAEGIRYYMPALVRLTLDTMEKPHETYIDQMLFHLLQDGMNNRLVSMQQGAAGICGGVSPAFG